MMKLAIAILAVALFGGCRSLETAESLPFEPRSAHANLLFFSGQTYVFATEQSPNAIGYNHPPRTLYLTLKSTASEAEYTLEDTPLNALKPGHATLRIAEHSQVPRLYVVESGTVSLEIMEGAWPIHRVRIDATLLDPLDGVRVTLQTTVDAPVAGIS